MLLCLRRLVMRLLRGQPLPRHVAFIMDGNRRFADQLSLQRIDGHRQGYSQMKQILQWCLELGVSCISVYAFSIDNFRRPQSEVDALMALAELKFEELMNDSDAKSWGAELRVIGDLSRAPPSVRAMAAKLMRSSKESQGPTRAVINICFSYTSSQELQQAVDQVCCGMQHSQLLPDDVTPELLHRVMHTQDCPPVDLLIRTSGEQRLSDFLLWQSSHALLYWDPCLWPEFGYASLLRALLAWQAAAPQLAALRAAADEAVAEDVLLQQLSGGSGACSPPPCPWSGQAAAAAAVHQQQQQQQQQPDAAAVELEQQLQQKLLQHEQQQQQLQQQLSSPFQQQQQQQQQQKAQKQPWLWGGLFSTTGGGWGTSSGWSLSGYHHHQQQQQQQQAVAGRSPDRAASMSLSMISEDEAICCPHPSQQLRVDQYLRRLAEQHARQLQVMAA